MFPSCRFDVFHVFGVVTRISCDKRPHASFLQGSSQLQRRQIWQGQASSLREAEPPSGEESLVKGEPLEGMYDERKL